MASKYPNDPIPVYMQFYSICNIKKIEDYKISNMFKEAQIYSKISIQQMITKQSIKISNILKEAQTYF